MPNATEVIESGGIDALIEAAKKKFDYIIIDTSPIGFMADAVLMTRYADHILLVVRNKATFKESFSEVITTLESNNISNYDVVFNDKNLSESTYGAYSRYYVKGK
jgi:tyrosine-protein kinase Etk/Wzc